MPWQAVAEIVGPVFVLMAVGWVLGALRPVDIGLLTDIVLYVGAPCLIFDSLSTGELDPVMMGTLALAATWIVCSVGLALRTVGAITGKRFGALYLPAMFMNSGNMLLPLTLFTYGETGLRYGITLFVTVTILQSSLGVTIASGRPSVTEMLRFPHIYAVLLALLINAAGVAVPAAIGRPIELLGDTAIPLMLIALGLRLRAIEISSWTRPLTATICRLAGGYGAGLLFVTAFDLDGEPRGCILLAAAMPAAVITFVFAEKYGRDKGDVAAAVALSTLVSTITIPLVLAYGL